jgi:hypothetical protein
MILGWGEGVHVFGQRELLVRVRTSTEVTGKIMPMKVDSKRGRWLSMNYNS